MATLHLLVAQAAKNSDPTVVPPDVVTKILAWFLGPHAVRWSWAASVQCDRMRFSWRNAGNRAWAQSFDAAPVEPVRQIITRAVSLVPEGWRRPPPTTAELASNRFRDPTAAGGPGGLPLTLDGCPMSGATVAPVKAGVWTVWRM